MRIRFLNLTDTAAPFLRNLIPFLVAEGYEIEVLISKAEYRVGNQLNIAIGKIDNVKIVQMSAFGLSRNNKITKTFVMLLYAIQASLFSLIGKDVDCNIFLTQPPLFSMWGYVLLGLRNQPYYIVLMDIYPQVAIELGFLLREARLTRFSSKLAKFLMKSAEGLVVIGRCMADRVEKMGVPKERIHYIHNWADERLIFPIEHIDNQFRSRQDWNSKFVVLYAGNISTPQYFDDILKVADQLQHRDNIVFVFIGDGSRRNEVEAKIKSLNLSNVFMYPFLHENYPLAEILSAGDMHFVSLKEEVTGLAVPSKSYGVLAVGRPMIFQGDRQCEIARMIEEEGVGEVISCGDVERLKQSILNYASHPELCKRRGKKARYLSESSYSRIHALERCQAVFTK